MHKDVSINININIKRKNDDLPDGPYSNNIPGTPDKIHVKKSNLVEKLEPIDRSHLTRANDSQPIVKNTSQLDQWTAKVPNRASILGTKTVFS